MQYASVIICTDPDLDPSITKQKIIKTVISTNFLHFFLTFLSLIKALNVPSKSNKQNIFKKYYSLVGILSDTDGKKQDPDPDLDP